MADEVDDIGWLVRGTEEYHLAKDDMREMVAHFSDVGKLGHRFSAVGELDEIDIGDGMVD
jgi:hypothetical protein